MKICFLLTHVPNPRINKRIEILKQHADTKVICTRRISQNIWEPSQDIEHVIFDIDLPSSKHIIKRYLLSRDFQKKALIKLNQINPNIIYAEGLDSLIIAGIYKRKHPVKIIFEVADLRENYIVKPKKLIDLIVSDTLMKREKAAFKDVDYLVITSPKFYEIHYKYLISEDRMIFIPNMPNPDVFKNFKRKNSGTFTVGFIGGIRYLKQMELLVDAANEVGCNVLFAGAGGTNADYNDIKNYCEGMSNVSFTGRYDYDTEIAGLYGSVDCIFSVYDADNPNVKIALPNKLYEAAICKLPLLVAKGTYLAELVDQYNLGLAVSHNDKDDLVNALKRIKDDNAFRESLTKNCDTFMKENCLNNPLNVLLNRVMEGYIS